MGCLRHRQNDRVMTCLSNVGPRQGLRRMHRLHILWVDGHVSWLRNTEARAHYYIGGAEPWYDTN